MRMLAMALDDTAALRDARLRICRGPFDRPSCNAWNWSMNTDIEAMRKGCGTERTRQTNGGRCTRIGFLTTEERTDVVFMSVTPFGGEQVSSNEVFKR